MSNLTIKTRLVATISLLSVILIAIGSYGLWGMSKSNEGLRTVYEDRTIPMGQLDDIKIKILHIRTAIVTAVKRVTDIMSEISAASNEQSQGIEQVNQAITQMDEVTQQNAALVEEAAAAAESLEEEAQSLTRSVSVFKLSEGHVGKSKAVALLGAPVETEKSNLDEAIAAHIKWKTRLTQFIDGTSTEKLDRDTVCKDNLCTLGKWIYGDGEKHKNVAHYEDLRSKHAHFHHCAGEVIAKVVSHDKAGANAILAGEFATVAKETVTAIMNLKKEIE